MSAAFSFSALALSLFVLKTTWPPMTAVTDNVHIFILLAAYLGFERTLLSGGVPTLLMGVLDSTFSGASGPVFLFTYGLVFLLCYILQQKANLVLVLYRMIVVLLLSLVHAAAVSVQIASLNTVAWAHLAASALITALLAPPAFLVFRGVELSVERMARRMRAKEAG